MTDPSFQTPTTYTGLVYFTTISDVIPQGMIQVSKEDMKDENWLLELVVKLFPDMDRFLKYGIFVMLTTSKVINLENFSAVAPYVDDDVLIFDRNYFRDQIRVNMKKCENA